MSGIKVYHAGTKKTEAGLVSSGGRVLTVTGTGVDFNDAIRQAYQAVAKVRFNPTDGLHFRKDIGHRALHRPTRVALVGSTRGSSSQVTLDAIRAGTLNAEVVLVVSNKADAGILERAKREGIRHVHLPCAKGTPRTEYDAGLTQLLRDEGVDLVLLVGFMRILSSEFCRDWESRCLNIHPSLLPKHAGGMDLEVHKAVLEAGETETGCTVHFVTEVVDGGACFVQRQVQVQGGDTPETLKARVQAEEGTALHEADRLIGEVVLPATSAAVRQDRERAKQ